MAIPILNDRHEWTEAHFAVQMKGTDWEIANVLEFNGRPYRTLRLCDTMEMAEREMAERKRGDSSHKREYRIVRL